MYYLKKILTAAVVMSLWTTASAAVYKCKDEIGGWLFTYKPCGKDSQVVHIEEKNKAIPSIKNIPAVRSPVSSLEMAGGERTYFKEMLKTGVKINKSYHYSKDGLYVPYKGLAHLVPFAKLISFQVLDHSYNSCGNTGHLCEVKARVTTETGRFSVEYAELRNVKVLIDDELSGMPQKLTVWFGNRAKTNIQEISWGRDHPPGKNKPVRNRKPAQRAAQSGTLHLTGNQRAKFKNILKTSVYIKDRYLNTNKGLYVPYKGTNRLTPFNSLVSFTVLRHPGKKCGNTRHICQPETLLETTNGKFRIAYDALRSITVLIDDELTGEEEQITVWFGDHGDVNLHKIVFD